MNKNIKSQKKSKPDKIRQSEDFNNFSPEFITWGKNALALFSLTRLKHNKPLSVTINLTPINFLKPQII